MSREPGMCSKAAGRVGDLACSGEGLGAVGGKRGSVCTEQRV